MNADRYDPLIAAGQVVCRACDAVAWPVTATWVDGRTVLATYAGTCAHLESVTWLVDTAAPPEPALAARCAGVTAAGRRCRLPVPAGRDRCHWHARPGVRRG